MGFRVLLRDLEIKMKWKLKCNFFLQNFLLYISILVTFMKIIEASFCWNKLLFGYVLIVGDNDAVILNTLFPRLSKKASALVKLLDLKVL